MPVQNCFAPDPNSPITQAAYGRSTDPVAAQPTDELDDVVHDINQNKERLGVQFPRSTHPYIATDEGWLYLAVLLDLYSRMVVGWSMSKRMTSTLVCDAMKMALGNRGAPKGVIVHSDRGSQYCSHEYQRLLAAHGLTCSMNKKGGCYDNAAMESWNHSLKVEAIHGEKSATREQVKAEVFDYIEVYYNRHRLHSTLGYQSSAEFEARHLA